MSQYSDRTPLAVAAATHPAACAAAIAPTGLRQASRLGHRPGLSAWLLLVWAVGAAMATAPARADGVAARPAAASSPPGDAMAAVQALIGDAACRSDADCHTVGVGQKACGGPAQYLAWSAYRSSGHAMERAASRTRVRPKADAAGGMMSTCQVLADPGAQCSPATPGPARAQPAGRCELRGRGAGNPGPVVR